MPESTGCYHGNANFPLFYLEAPPSFIFPILTRVSANSSSSTQNPTSCHISRVQIGGRVEAVSRHSMSTWSATICLLVACTAPYSVYINTLFCRMICRRERNLFSGKICALSCEPISDTSIVLDIFLPRFSGGDPHSMSALHRSRYVVPLPRDSFRCLTPE
jgi:hypothetical protein